MGGSWDFSKLPDRMHDRVITLYRQRDYPEVKKILKAHGAMPNCSTCSNREFTLWMQSFIDSKSTQDVSS